MQNKHQKIFLLSVSQPPGRGSSRLVQKTKFVKGNISGAPLSIPKYYVPPPSLPSLDPNDSGTLVQSQ